MKNNLTPLRAPSSYTCTYNQRVLAFFFLSFFLACQGPQTPIQTPIQTPTETVYEVGLLAGSGTAADMDGTGAAAQFNLPRGIAVGSDGTFYVADTFNNRFRKITPAGAVSLLAGSGQGYMDGTGANARFNQPYRIAVGTDGMVYVADTLNSRIRKITPAGAVSLLAGSTFGYMDGTSSDAKFNTPYGIAVGPDGTVYVADSNNHRIRKITPAGAVSLLAGGRQGYADGTGSDAQFNTPFGVAVGPDGMVYVADSGNNRIRKITSTGVVSLLAGSTLGHMDGTGSGAIFNTPYGIAVGPDGTVYVADTNNHQIRKITPAGVVSLVAGSSKGYVDGIGAAAQFDAPYGIAVGPDGTIYVADTNNNRIRKITPRQVTK